MFLRDISFSSPKENIAYDDVMLAMADIHGAGEYLRFWESSVHFVVLGLTGKENEDVNSLHTEMDRVPILRRSSGGGTVLQGPGCLNYSLVISKDKHPHLADLRKSYEWISAQIIEALRMSGVDAYFKPTSDLAIGAQEKKFSGNAQTRKRQYLLHHGTILYRFDLSLITRYLNMPKEIPEYRKNRPHTDFVTNIPLMPQVFKNNLSLLMNAHKSEPPTTKELLLMKEFLIK